MHYMGKYWCYRHGQSLVSANTPSARRGVGAEKGGNVCICVHASDEPLRYVNISISRSWVEQILCMRKTDTQNRADVAGAVGPSLAPHAASVPSSGRIRGPSR